MPGAAFGQRNMPGSRRFQRGVAVRTVPGLRALAGRAGAGGE
ncbi:MAG: hypothetical protein ACK52I_22895 [Pseudomonadota bacterium]